MSVNARIRRARLDLGLTEQQLAGKVGVSRAAIQNWEREGGSAPKRSNQAVVAGVLGMSIAEMMNPGDAQPQQAGEAAEVQGLSSAALDIARLFDLLPVDQITRTMAYNSTTAEILRALRESAESPKSGQVATASVKTQRA